MIVWKIRRSTTFLGGGDSRRPLKKNLSLIKLIYRDKIVDSIQSCMIRTTSGCVFLLMQVWLAERKKLVIQESIIFVPSFCSFLFAFWFGFRSSKYKHFFRSVLVEFDFAFITLSFNYRSLSWYLPTIFPLKIFSTRYLIDFRSFCLILIWLIIICFSNTLVGFVWQLIPFWVHNKINIINPPRLPTHLILAYWLVYSYSSTKKFKKPVKPIHDDHGISTLLCSNDVGIKCEM